MPSFNSTLELLTSIVDTVVIILIVDRSCQAVAEHAFSEGWKRVDWVLLEEPSCQGGITLRLGDVRIWWWSELEELILGYPSLSKALEL